MSAVRSQPYYLDVTHSHAYKGGVVAYLSRRLGIDSGQIATIGDQRNDVLMFRPSGFSIAMGNASDYHTWFGMCEPGIIRRKITQTRFAAAIERP